MLRKKLAVDFAQQKYQKHCDSWFFLSLDNLSAHAAKDEKNMFVDSQALLIYFLSQATESAQPSDVGCGRSISYHTGNLLDRWLTMDKNLVKWE